MYSSGQISSCLSNSYKNNTGILSSLLSMVAFFYPFSTLQAEWVEFINDASIEVIHNDNVNRSAFSADELSDTAIRPAYTFGRFYQASDLTRLRLSLDLSASLYDKFDKFDSVDAKASAIAVHKFGIGFNKPWLRGKLSVGRKDADVDIRDTTLYEVGLATGKRFGERLSGQLGLVYNNRNGSGSGVVAVVGKSSKVFDIENTAFSVGLDYLLTERSQVSAGLTHRRGEFDSACTPENAGIVLDSEKDNVKAITLDDVFGGCVYRLDGSSNALKLQYSYAINRHSSLNLGYQKRQAKADVLDYDSDIWNVSFMYSR